jgi:hypothetical protein
VHHHANCSAAKQPEAKLYLTSVLRHVFADCMTGLQEEWLYFSSQLLDPLWQALPSLATWSCMRGFHFPQQRAILLLFLHLAGVDTAAAGFKTNAL